MTITILVIAFALCAIALLSTAVRARRNHAVIQAVRPLDLNAFRMLMDRDDELFLRDHLSHESFSHLKRRRIRVTWKYVSRIAGNTSVVVRLCENARQSNDPEVAQAASEVINLATQIRTQCLVAFAKLSVEFVVPSMQLTPAVLESKYQSLRENVSKLGSLQPQNVAPLASAI